MMDELRVILAIFLLALVLGATFYYISNRNVEFNGERLTGPTEIASVQITGPGKYMLVHDLTSGWNIAVQKYDPVYNGSVNIVANNANAVGVTSPFAYAKTDYALVEYNMCVNGALQAGNYIIIRSLEPIDTNNTNCQTIPSLNLANATITTDDPNVDTIISNDKITIHVIAPSGAKVNEVIDLGDLSGNSIVFLLNASYTSGYGRISLYLNDNDVIKVQASSDLSLQYTYLGSSYNTKVSYTSVPVPLVLVYNGDGTYSIYYNGHYVNRMDAASYPIHVKIVVDVSLTSTGSEAVFNIYGVFGLDNTTIARSLSYGVFFLEDGQYPIPPSVSGEDTTVLVSAGHYITVEGSSSLEGEDAITIAPGTYDVTIWPKWVELDIPGYYIVANQTVQKEYHARSIEHFINVRNANLTVYANGTGVADVELVKGRDWLQVIVKENGIPLENAYVYLYSSDGVLIDSNITGSDGTTYFRDPPESGTVYVYAYYDSILLRGTTSYTEDTTSTDTSPPNNPMPPAEVEPEQLAAQNNSFLTAAILLLIIIIAAVLAGVILK